MITELTLSQIKKFPEYVKKWTDIGLSTNPANREEAEKYINESYKLAGLKTPKKIIWCGSPLSQGLVRAIILDKKIISNISNNISDSVRASVKASVSDSVSDSLWASVKASVWVSLRASVSDSVSDSVRDSLSESVGASVGDSLWASVKASVWVSLRASVSDSVMDSVRASLSDRVSNSVGASVWASLRASVADSVMDSGYGQHDAHWLGFYDFFRNELNLKEQTEKLTGLIELSKHAGWYLPHKDICWVSERHSLLNRDDRGRLHSVSQPAVLYPDGWAIYAVHGVRVPEKVIMRANEITVDEIEKEKNAEIRRIMIDQYGPQRFIIDSGSVMINEDKFGKLYRKEISNDEPLVMVKVRNSTPETDGSIKDYFLRVPPDCKTAEEAVAWTFGFEGEKYNPIVET